MMNKKCPKCSNELQVELDTDFVFSGFISYITTLPAISDLVLGDSKILLLPGACVLLLVGVLFFLSVENKPSHWWQKSRLPLFKNVILFFIAINIGFIILAYTYKYVWLS